MTPTFQPLMAEHIPLLRKWLKEPHVAEYWQEPENESEFKQKFLQKLPERGVRPYLIYWDSQPIGYIQDYEANLVGGGWWTDASPGTFGIDQFIGDSDFVNKGLGTKIIRTFIHRLFENPSVKEIITDPDPKNNRAIRAYEKVGFKKAGQIKTPGGDAILMRLNRADLKLYRFQVGNVGIYEAVDRDCPGNDKRREAKPDGSWLRKVGTKYPGAISFWKELGVQKYKDSGLRAWHESVVAGKVSIIERTLEDIEVLYEDEFQVIGNFKR